MNNKMNMQTRLPLLRFGTVRSGAVYVLFVAWLAFSFNTILQHCCRALATGTVHGVQVATGAPAIAGGPVHSNDSHSDDNDPCPQLTSLDAIAPGVPLLPGSAHAVFVVARYVVSDVAATTFVPAFNFHPPPPPWRLYLSTQRLRI